MDVSPLPDAYLRHRHLHLHRRLHLRLHLHLRRQILYDDDTNRKYQSVSFLEIKESYFNVWIIWEKVILTQIQASTGLVLLPPFRQ